MKKKMITLLALAGFVALSSQAFAAASLNAGNATIAYEKLTAGAVYAIPAFNTAYQPGGPVAATTQLKVSTTGTFAARPDAAATGWNICNGAVKMASTGVGSFGVVTTGGESAFTLTLVSPLASGTAYTIQDDNCNAAYTAVSKLQVPADATVNSTISLTIDNALNAGDANVYATATATTVKKQFSAVLYPVISTIDFGASSKKFKTVGTAPIAPYTVAGAPSNSFAGLLFLSDETIGTKVATALSSTTCLAAALNAADLIKVKVDGTFTEAGTSAVGVNTTVAVTPVVAGALVVAQNATAAVKNTDTTATVNVTGNLIAGCGTGTSAATLAKHINVIDVNVPGTGVLVPRTFNTSVQFAGATTTILNSASNLGYLVTSALSHTWKQDTTSYIAPWVKFSPDQAAGAQTYFKLTYKGTNASTAALKINVVATDGQVKVLDFGTLTAGQTRQVTGGEIQTAAAAAGYTLGQVNGIYNFPAVIEIQAAEADTYAYAVATAGTFYTRIPMRVHHAAGTEFIAE